MGKRQVIISRSGLSPLFIVIVNKEFKSQVNENNIAATRRLAWSVAVI